MKRKKGSIFETQMLKVSCPRIRDKDSLELTSHYAPSVSLRAYRWAHAIFIQGIYSLQTNSEPSCLPGACFLVLKELFYSETDVFILKVGSQHSE